MLTNRWTPKKNEMGPRRAAPAADESQRERVARTSRNLVLSDILNSPMRLSSRTLKRHTPFGIEQLNDAPRAASRQGSIPMSTSRPLMILLASIEMVSLAATRVIRYTTLSSLHD